MYRMLCIFSDSSQNVLYTLLTFDGCEHDFSSGAPYQSVSGIIDEESLPTIISVWNPLCGFDLFDDCWFSDKFELFRIMWQLANTERPRSEAELERILCGEEFTYRSKEKAPQNVAERTACSFCASFVSPIRISR